MRNASLRFGTVDILVNNAARVPNAPAEEARRNLHQQYVTTPMPRRSHSRSSDATQRRACCAPFKASMCSSAMLHRLSRLHLKP